MLAFTSRRLGQALLVLLGATILVFILVRVLPGDAADLMSAGEGATAAERQELRQVLGLDQPLPFQYLTFMGNVLQGDLGNSLTQSRPVLEVLSDGLGATLQLTLVGLVIATVIALPLALVSALRQNSVWDRVASVGSMFGASMPSFWQGILLILIFCVAVPVLPTGGIISSQFSVAPVTDIPIVDAILAANWAALWSNVLHLILPAITLGTHAAAMLTRVLRASLLEIKHQDFMDSLRARGLPEWKVTLHMLRNALPTTVILFGSKLGTLLGGTMVIEVVFSWPGLGSLLVGAIGSRDYPVVQGAVLLATVMVVSSNLLADIVHGWLDPRIKHSAVANA